MGMNLFRRETKSGRWVDVVQRVAPFPDATHDTPEAALARSNAPGFSWCGRCGFPWVDVKHHVTQYRPGNGCFPLCETCWSITDIEGRIVYYHQLWDIWNEYDNNDVAWEEFERAVLLEAGFDPERAPGWS